MPEQIPGTVAEKCTMSLREVRRALRTTKPFFGWVNLSENDGAYIQLCKSSVRLAITDPDSEYQIKEREDGFYIN